MNAKKWLRIWCFRGLLGLALGIALTDVLEVVSPQAAYPAGSQLAAIFAYVSRQADICTLSETVRAPLTSVREARNISSLSSTCREISKNAGYALWRTPKGDIWCPESSSSALFVDVAEQQRHIYDIGGKGVTKGDIVLDCGANVGLFTREALASGASRVIAIEPAPENLECLRRNLADEIRAGKVIVYAKGVWDKEDSLLLHRPASNSAADSLVRVLSAGDTVRVALTTIDRLVKELALPHVDFIKMDIEGAERQALSGAVHTLRAYKPRMSIAVYHLPGDTLEIPKRVKLAVPRYRFECSCVIGGMFKVAPEVMQFY